MIEALAFPALLSLLNYLSERIHVRFQRHKLLEERMFSFVSGVLVTFLFLYLLPELFLGIPYVPWFLYIYVLLGFTAYLLIHEILYKYEPNKERLRFELQEAHGIVAFIIHFIIGMVLARFISFDDISGAFLLFIPLAIHVSFSSLASHHVAHSKTYKEGIIDDIIQTLVCLAPLLGAIFAIFINFPSIVIYALYGVTGGVLLFIVIREFIPKPKEAKPLFFVLGQLAFILLTVFRVLYIS